MIIKDKICIVFGAAQGIGLAYAEALLQRQAVVYVIDINQKEGSQAVLGLATKFPSQKVFFRKCNITDEKQIANVFIEVKESQSRIDIVVNNCGIIHEFDWPKCLDINVGGHIRCIDACRKFMGKDNGGHGGVFVATSSISGLRPEPWGPVYCASKHASVGLIRAWALPENYQQHGIRMNCICPTRVDTRFLEQVVPERALHAEELLSDPEQAENAFRPDQIAHGLILLVEDDTKNGAVLRITRAHGYDFAKFQDTPPQ